MTHTSKDFLYKFLEEHPVAGKVLEIGSRNINGSIKEILIEHGLEYQGLDMVYSGDPDEIIMNAHDIKDKFEKETYDFVVCLDTLEHDDKFWLTVENMRWVLKKGGWMLIVAPSVNCPIHDWPSDYYRFLLTPFKEVFFEGFKNCYFEDNQDAIYGWGQK